MSAPIGASSEDRLDSWKEISAYLGREVRTVQGWEKLEGLPVHRHQHGRQGSVYAFKSELDAWRDSRRESPEPAAVIVVEPPRRRAPIAMASICVVAVIAGTVGWFSRRPAPGGDIPQSVVVLPFLDLSPQHDQDYFSDGLTEEIIDALTRVPNLRVVARTSSFAFKGKAADVRSIGQQLNVAAVLEGSVRKSGDQLRITAQLARVSDGYHLWSRTYDRNLRDVFAVQREISEAIAGQLRAGAVPRREQTRDVEAWRLFQEGRYFFNQMETPSSNWKAIERYQQAIARDPKFAQAYAGMADAYAYLAENFAVAPKEVMPQAREAAEKALALDDSSADAHVSLGLVKLDYDRDHDGAQREFVRAMQLNSGSAYARHWYAHSLEAQRRLPEAMIEMRKALEMDPLSVVINWDVTGELISAGKFDDALRQVNEASELFPNVPMFPYIRVFVLLGRGDTAGASRAIAQLRVSHPELVDDPMFMALFGVESVLEGRPAEGRAMLVRMEALRSKRYVDAFLVLPLCAALKDRAVTLRWLERAADERSSMVVYLPLMKAAYGIDDAMLAEAGVL
jgi:TolB-like protein